MTSQQTLKQFYNEIFGQQITKINQAYKFLRVNNKDDAYDLLDREYDKYIKILNKADGNNIIKRAKEKASLFSKNVLEKIKSKANDKDILKYKY